MRARWSLLLGVVLACDDGFAKGWDLDRLRVLGARVEAGTDPARAALRPGEAGRVTWLLAGPEPTGVLGWAFATCAPPTGDRAEPVCAGELFERGTGQSEGELIAMDLTASARSTDALVLAAFCSGSPPTLDPATFTARCADGPALLASTTLHVGSDNRNPDFADDQLQFDGNTWGAVETPSCTEAIPQVLLPGIALPLGLTLRDQDREPIAEGGVETLMLSSFVDDGVLDRQYSVQEPGPLAAITLQWTSTYPAKKQLVHFVFVLRDGRGGMAFARRAVCVHVPSTERNEP